MKKLILLSFAILTVLVGCSKNDDDPGKDYIVYIAGFYTDDSGKDVACCWANGARTDLALPAGAGDSRAYSVSLSGGLVYISGYYVDDRGRSIACYWVDGACTDLSAPEGAHAGAYAIAVAGGSIYIAGDYYDGVESMIACYWRDGKRTDFANPEGERYVNISSITVAGGKVYVAGHYGEIISVIGKPIPVYPCYWVDGERIDLTFPEGMITSYTHSIVVSGGSVYIGGDGENSNKTHTCYWIDGIPMVLPVPAGASATYRSLSISDGSIYATGTCAGAACYWINDELIDLPVPGEAKYAGGWSIAVLDDMVCVAGLYNVYGNTYSIQSIPCYWVDGERSDLAVPARVGNVRTLSIAVVRR